MSSNDTPPSQSLIDAAVQSLFHGAGAAVAGVVGAGVAVAGVAGAGVAVAGVVGAGDVMPRAIRDAGLGPLVLNPVNIVQMYHSLLVPSVSATGQSIPREHLDGPLAVDRSCLDPQFDHDFTNISDSGNTFRRGNQPYERPCGSYRIALKVKDKFGTNNDWLGMKGDGPGEWPVSYHGTALHNALNIAEEGFRLSRGRRFMYGTGIYSTPELAVAQDYASSFVHEGTSYKCVIQNRVNPKYLKVIPKAETHVGTYWLSAADQDVSEIDFIRPYGLCLFKVKSGCAFI